jgi:hypothetical protein
LQEFTQRDSYRADVVQVLVLSLNIFNTFVNKVDFQKLELKVIPELLSIFNFVPFGDVKGGIASFGGGRPILKSIEIKVKEWLHRPRVELRIIPLKARALSN